MKRPKCRGQRFGHNFAGSVCLNGCGTNQVDLSSPGKVRGVRWINNDFFNGYLGRLASRPRTAARNHREEITLPYMKHFIWEDRDGEKFLRQMNYFWASSITAWKKYTPFEYEKILKWAAKRPGMTAVSVCRAFTRPKY